MKKTIDYFTRTPWVSWAREWRCGAEGKKNEVKGSVLREDEGNIMKEKPLWSFVFHPASLYLIFPFFTLHASSVLHAFKHHPRPSPFTHLRFSSNLSKELSIQYPRSQLHNLWVLSKKILDKVGNKFTRPWVSSLE